jgi:hypothetical protein
MADNNRPASLPPPLDVAKAQKYICPPKGCAAGELCKYVKSKSGRQRAPTGRYACFNCKGKVHQEYSCAETIHNVMEGGHSRLQYEYLSPHGIALFEDAVSRLNGGNRRAAVPAARVWHELQNELICHKCFDDYISLLEIYYDAPGDEEDEEEDPQQPGDDEEYANDAVDAGEEAGGVDAVGMDSVEEGMLEEVPADEEGAVSADGEEQEAAPVAAWSHINSWTDLHRFPLEDLQVQSWLSNRNVYGKEWPMLLVVMCIGHAIIGDSEISRFCVL